MNRNSVVIGIFIVLAGIVFLNSIQPKNTSQNPRTFYQPTPSLGQTSVPSPTPASLNSSESDIVPTRISPTSIQPTKSVFRVRKERGDD